MPIALLFIVTLSGFSALVFEGLWFRQASLGLGSSVWASSLVLAGFMAGIAVGNLLASRLGDRSARPMRIIASLEACIALSGIALVYALPWAGGTASRLIGTAAAPWVLQSVRFLISFVLLLVPTTAMGATLPLLTRTLATRGSEFGLVLGLLYGMNTLGGTFGALCSEMVLVERLGVHLSAWVSGGADLLVALGALALASGFEPIAPTDRPLRRRLSSRWVVAAAVSGFAVLALEVVWFRFLLLYMLGTPAAFTIMLAAVLMGIGAGGILAGRLADEYSITPCHAGVVSLLGGVVTWLGYMVFPKIQGPLLGNGVADKPVEIALSALLLVFPVCLASGVFFPLMGTLIRREMGRDAESVGVLTLANTAGATLGALAAGFVLLPKLGVEDSVFALGLLLVANGLMVAVADPGGRRTAVLSGLATAAVAAVFPFGLMRGFHIQQRALWFGGEVAAVREGLTETLVYLRNSFHGETTSIRMATNRFSMASNKWSSRRYMKLYTWLPVAVHPDLERALLISFGCGQTARSLVDTASLREIDIVDISKDIVEMNSVVFPNPLDRPTNDKRVRVHIDDGRYFLAATTKRYDLITGEPPPPPVAGVVNLYTREFFQLVYDRLAEGGITTYWLPIHDLSDASSKSVLHAFCDVFKDCTLWQGYSSNLMMVGTRGALPTVSPEHFAAQWRNPRVAPELRALGFERPEQLGALFIGDADWLRTITADTPALVDDQPSRLYAPFTCSDPSLAPRYPDWPVRRPDAYSWNPPEYPNPTFESWIAVGPEAEARFQRSSQVRRLFPPKMIAGSLPYFASQRVQADVENGREVRDAKLVDLLDQGITLPALLALGSDPDIQAVLPRISGNDPAVRLQRAIGKLVHGAPSAAVATLADLDTPAARRVKEVARSVRFSGSKAP